MSVETLNEIVVLEALSCGECHVRFALPREMHTKVQVNGSSFYCPNGHYIAYGKSEVQKLKKQLQAKQETVDYYVKRNDELYGEKTHAERQAAARKGLVTKIKNRVAKGICPCCNRTFENLARHMQSQHPDYAHDTNAATTPSADSGGE